MHLARVPVLIASFLVWPVASAGGQDYTGTYTVANQPGGTVTLTLRQAPGGQLTGSLTGTGSQFQVEGMVEEGTAMGVITSGQGGVFFEATLDGEQLTLVLVEVGEGNMPDYSKARTRALRRSGAGEAASAGKPLAGARAGQAGGSGGLRGQWSCQTGTGLAPLAFLSGRELVFNGQRTPYERGQGVIRVPGEFGPVEYRYQLSGDQLAVTGPDGSAMQCRRQRAGAAGAGSGMEALLQGWRCAYSSSPDGGFSTLDKMHFDGQGRFVSGTETSFSGDPGYAFGLHNDPNAGRHQVTGTGGGATIHMTWPDGSIGVATVYLGDASVIREFRLNGRHYGPGLRQ